MARKTGTRVYFDNKDMDCVETSLPYVFLVFLLAVAVYLAILSGKIPMASAMKTDQLKGGFEPVNDLSGESEGPTKTISFWLRSQQLKPLQPSDRFFESTRWKRYDVAEFEDPMICFWLSSEQLRPLEPFERLFDFDVQSSARRGYGKRPGDCQNRRIGKAFPARLSLAEMKSATKRFYPSQIIGGGEGPSGSVFQGSFASGKEAASEEPEMEAHFVVQLVGCCCEGDERVLVVSDFMPYGSLDRFLHFMKATNRTSVFLNWECRRKIVLGLECETKIIRRDVKARKIVLDGEYNSKLADSGLYHRKFYSFGVAVLEVATGRRPVEIDGCILVDKVWEMWSKGKLMEVVDSRLLARFEIREMERVLMVGLAWLHPDSKKRPKMKEAEEQIQFSLSENLKSVSQDVLLMPGDRNGWSDTPPW